MTEASRPGCYRRTKRRRISFAYSLPRINPFPTAKTRLMPDSVEIPDAAMERIQRLRREAQQAQTLLQTYLSGLASGLVEEPEAYRVDLKSGALVRNDDTDSE